MSQTPYRRNLRRRLTAVQARLDAGAGDRWIPYAIGSALGATMAVVSVSRLNSLAAGENLAGYVQAVYLLSEGLRPEASILGEGVHLLEVRWSFLLYLLAFPARFAPVAETLLIAQAVALGVTVVPLWKLARDVARLRVGTATAICLAYAFHPATQSIGALDFHPEALALPGLVAMVYFGITKQQIPYWICVAWVLLAEADMGFVIAVFAILILGDSARSTGLWTIGIGLVWSLALLLVAQPLSGETGVIGGNYGEYGDSFGDALLTVVSNPLSFLSDFVGRGNVTLLLGLLTPVLFLPLLSLRHLLPAIPAAILLLLIQSAGQADGLAPIMAFVMVSTVFALKRLGTLGVDRVFVDTRLLTALIAASLLLFVTLSPLSPYEEPWNLNERDNNDIALVQAASRLDANVPVRASANVLPLLAERPFAYPLADETPTVASVVFRSRAVLIDQRTLDVPLVGDRLGAFTEQMNGLGFDRLNAENDTILLYFRP